MQEHLLKKRKKLQIIGFKYQVELQRINLGYALPDLEFPGGLQSYLLIQ